MANLKGSEKQIKWAEDIKKQLISGVNDFYSKKNEAEEQEEYRVCLDMIENETSAAWFIENRNSSIADLLAPYYNNKKAEQRIANRVQKLAVRLEKENEIAFKLQTMKDDGVDANKFAEAIKETCKDVTIEFTAEKMFVRK